MCAFVHVESDAVKILLANVGRVREAINSVERGATSESFKLQVFVLVNGRPLKERQVVHSRYNCDLQQKG